MSFSAQDHEFMALALRLAERGLYTTDPNPRVGCVIADGDRVVGQGWHERAGGAHAEIAALNDAAEPVRGMTAYVTLEPCAHHGRTPPCADALVEAGIVRVVVPTEDPHERVDGGGLQRLRGAGIRVEAGLMAPQAERLNAGFLKRTRTGRPWLRVKSAVSLDGRTALRNGESKWITGDAARRDVQRWRARSSAILTGIGTVLADNPEMTARVAGALNQPLRVIADSRWRTPPASRILAGKGTTLVAGLGKPPQALESSAAQCLEVPAGEGGVDLGVLLDELGRREINEVQVEAGAVLCGALLQQGLVDEVLLYVAPLLLGDGGPGPFAFGPLESMANRTHFKVLETSHVGNDLRLRLQPQKI
ncbi:MAG: bifunctional diaminohydroxyphosphoribosylaminopyrimidine deaminase/5-amino-6-(5-phosphoribosylamino)uracil reductase RibD [Xanthomonadales bacterium]|nr:bifunctional diaminohydroxyphosphoribosylaminopyrimidine deaminase/5-amino-6-(5-phosphoribosylamino)uracil reductase RibD [Xanthomonadales bacterium]